MSMAQYGSLLTVSNDEREELMRWAQSRTFPAGDVFRARLILALAVKLSYREIEKLNTSYPNVVRRGRRTRSTARKVSAPRLRPSHHGADRGGPSH